MRPSSAITASQKAHSIKEATKKLRSLLKCPHLKELLREISLASKEEEILHSGNCLTNPKFSGTISILTLSRNGLEEKIIKRVGYKYTRHGYDMVACPFASKIGGTEEKTSRFIKNHEIPVLVEKYNLDAVELEKVINKIA